MGWPVHTPDSSQASHWRSSDSSTVVKVSRGWCIQNFFEQLKPCPRANMEASRDEWPILGLYHIVTVFSLIRSRCLEAQPKTAVQSQSPHASDSTFEDEHLRFIHVWRVACQVHDQGIQHRGVCPNNHMLRLAYAILQHSKLVSARACHGVTLCQVLTTPCADLMPSI